MEYSLRKDTSERPTIRRMPSFRHARLVLLALGLSALSLALVLGVMGATTGNASLWKIAVFYMPIAVGCLLLRALLVWLKKRRKKIMRQRRERTYLPTDSSGFT